ncbi:hypothetical protein ACHAXS_000353 [Conticribra weissflogii]
MNMDTVVDSLIQMMTSSLSFAQFGGAHRRSDHTTPSPTAATCQAQKLDELIVDWPNRDNDFPSHSLETIQREKAKAKKRVRFSESSEMRVYWIQQAHHVDHYMRKSNEDTKEFNRELHSKSADSKNDVDDSNELFSLYSQRQQSNLHEKLRRARRSSSSARAA